MSYLARIRPVLQRTLEKLLAASMRTHVAKSLPTSSGESTAPIPFVVYFADVPSSTYQLEQWIAPMEELQRVAGPVALIIRNPFVARHIATRSALEIYLLDTSSKVERFVSDRSVRVVFYVNNSQSNFTILRINGPAHVHLSHGESEKSSMYSNQLKVYDFVFIAGAESEDRILAGINRFDPKHLVKIGRPQLANVKISTPRSNGSASRTRVLYAPTWEGDSPDMAYGSLQSHGIQLVKLLVADPRIGLVVRFHPKTGTRSASYKAARLQILREIKRASRLEADSIIDEETDAATSIAGADVVVTDVSAMAMDALGLNKPLVLCVSGGALTDGLIAHVPTWQGSIPSSAVDELIDAASRSVSNAQASYKHDVFGPGSPEDAVAKFIEAAAAVARGTQPGQC